MCAEKLPINCQLQNFPRTFWAQNFFFSRGPDCARKNSNYHIVVKFSAHIFGQEKKSF